jgi:hypothetical protein
VLKRYGPSLVTFVLVVIIGILLSIPKSHFLYPDSYVYEIITRSQDFFISSLSYNGVTIPFDYFVAIKPFATVVTSFLLWSGPFVSLLNITFVIAGITAIIFAIKDKKKSLHNSLLTALLVVSSGAIIYWISRASTEYFSFMLLCFLISTLWKKQVRLGVIIAGVLAFVRPEILFTYPLLFRIAGKYKARSMESALYAVVLAIYFVIAFISNSGILAIIYILFPFIGIVGTTYLLENKNIQVLATSFAAQLMKIGIPIMMGLSSILIILAAFGIVSSSLTPVFGSILCGGMLLLITYIYWHEKIVVQYHLIFAAIVLASVYLYNSGDSFRYLIYVIPFIIAILLSSKWEDHFSQVLARNTLYIAIIFQIVMAIIVIPFDNLSESYWQERLRYSFNDGATIVSSTPIISAFAGFRSLHICEKSPDIERGTYYVIDGYARQLCKATVEMIENDNRVKKVSVFSTKTLVQIDRFSKVGDTTTIYFVE